MTDLRQAAQQALEALKSGMAFDKNAAVLQNLRTALEQPEPQAEPVAWEHHEYRPYGAPGQIRIHAILASQFTMPDGSIAGDFQWLVDEYKKDKNTIKLFPLYTTPPAAQPPAEWPLIKNILAEYGLDAIAFVAEWKAAQRTWVGLDEDDIRKLYGKDLNYRDGNYVRYAMAVEAKLKEKNGY